MEHTLERFSFEHNGATLVYWHRPSDGKRWVILLPGAGIDHHVWDRQIPAFDASFDLILCDVRGQGASQLHPGNRVRFDDLIDDLVAVYAHRGIGRAALVGHSYGGNIVQEFAYRYPDRVERYVMVGSRGQHWKMGRSGAVGVRVLTGVNSVLPWKWFCGYAGRWSSRNPETIAYIEKCLLRTGRRTFLDLGVSGFASVHDPAAYDPPVPTLLIRGEHDHAKALDAIYAGIAAKNPRCERVVIPATIHQPMQDAPEEFNRVLLEFLEKST